MPSEMFENRAIGKERRGKKECLAGVFVGRFSGDQELPSSNFYSPSWAPSVTGVEDSRDGPRSGLGYNSRGASVHHGFPRQRSCLGRAPRCDPPRKSPGACGKSELASTLPEKDPKHRAVWPRWAVQAAGEFTAP